MAYMHYRLNWNPEMEIEAIRQEYFSAFGPAAADVEQYFDYWENYAATRPAYRDISTDPQGALDEIQKDQRTLSGISAAGLSACGSDPGEGSRNGAKGSATRVCPSEWNSCRRASSSSRYPQAYRSSWTSKASRAERGSAPKDPKKLKQAKRAMQELIQFRHDPKNRFVSDYISNATVEKNQIINIETLFDGKGTSKGTDPDDGTF